MLHRALLEKLISAATLDLINGNAHVEVDGVPDSLFYSSSEKRQLSFSIFPHGLFLRKYYVVEVNKGTTMAEFPNDRYRVKMSSFLGEKIRQLYELTNLDADQLKKQRELLAKLS
ncbi:MAG: hypothetical protein G01um101429_1097 [Parcubacteria group bacterium Gr01-1014_29]|nr:MAG: hypothetical protein G01um101429_1097 [Parcubacteria group bacterium Gr01-1014_29]